jgi:hypothetical protein
MPDSTEPKGPAPLTAQQVIELYTELRSNFAARNSDYANLRQLYRGEHWGSTDNPLPEGKHYTLAVNYVAPTVDKAVDQVFGTMPGIQVMSQGTDEDARRLAEQQEAILYGAWAKNDAEFVFRRAAHNRSLLGRGVLYYWWDAGAECVKFKSVAPDNFYPVYDGDVLVECILVSRRLTRGLQHSYPGMAAKITADPGLSETFDGVNAADIFDASRFDGDQVVIPSNAATKLASYTTVIDWYDRFGNWVRIMGDAVHKQNLGYGLERVPVIEWPNGLPGDEREPRSDVADIYSLNLYLDTLLSQDADIIKRYSNPTVLDKQSGQSAQEIRQTIQAEGGVLPIKRDGDIVYLNWQGTPPDIQQQYERVLNAIYDLSGRPATSYGNVLSNQSGAASNMALNPLIADAQDSETIIGSGLVLLNTAILALYAKFSAGTVIHAKGARPKRPGLNTYVPYASGITGDDMGGWFENRIKWPSALRTDDPVYVQNEIAKSNGDGNNPPKQSLYTTLENLGIEDVEAEMDRIKAQLEDPRLHPQVLQASTAAAARMQRSMLPDGTQGLDPATAAGADPALGGSPAEFDAALNAAGNPNGSKSTKESPATGY